eukprot:09917_6
MRRPGLLWRSLVWQSERSRLIAKATPTGGRWSYRDACFRARWRWSTSGATGSWNTSSMLPTTSRRGSTSRPLRPPFRHGNGARPCRWTCKRTTWPRGTSSLASISTRRSTWIRRSAFTSRRAARSWPLKCTRKPTSGTKPTRRLRTAKLRWGLCTTRRSASLRASSRRRRSCTLWLMSQTSRSTCTRRTGITITYASLSTARTSLRRTCIWRSSWRRRTSSRTLRCTMSTPTTGRVLSTCTAHTNYGTMPYAPRATAALTPPSRWRMRGRCRSGARQARSCQSSGSSSKQSTT